MIKIVLAGILLACPSSIRMTDVAVITMIMTRTCIYTIFLKFRITRHWWTSISEEDDTTIVFTRESVRK